MNVRNVLATTALGVVMFAQSALAAPPRVYENVFGSVGGCESIGASFSDDANGISYAQVWQYEACMPILNCYVEVPGGNLVQMHSQASQGKGALPPDVLMPCFTGVAPTSLSLDCGANGSFEQHTSGKNTVINNGVRFTAIGDTDSSIADCTLVVDDVTYEVTSGQIYRLVEKTKP